MAGKKTVFELVRELYPNSNCIHKECVHSVHDFPSTKERPYNHAG